MVCWRILREGWRISFLANGKANFDALGRKCISAPWAYLVAGSAAEASDGGFATTGKGGGPA